MRQTRLPAVLRDCVGCLPGPTNMRRANGDNRMKPAHFWVGATHTASVVRLEPLE